MSCNDDENTIHLGEIMQEAGYTSNDESSSSPPLLLDKSSRSSNSVHYSEASSSVMTPMPVCDVHDGDKMPIVDEDVVSTKEVYPQFSTKEADQQLSGDEVIPQGDEASIASTLVTNPSVASGNSVSQKSECTEGSFNSSYETSSKRGNKLNLDFMPVRDSVKSSGGSVYSRSSKKSVRRRDVIKPVALPPKPVALPPKEATMSSYYVHKGKGTDSAKNSGQMVPSANSPKSQWALPSNPQAGCTELVSVPTNSYNNYSVPNNNFALVVHGSQPRGIDPSETCRGNGRDPPGEEPTARPSPSNPSPGARKYRNVQWVDPKNITDESEIDHDMLHRYRQLSPDYSPYESDLSGEQKRIRIATISSGYKTANFFVREDLDQRIYFHELEDAVSYMARRGYARMEKGQEKEWMKLLKRAHEVVKVGPTKKKQRYRKGKLVLIMYKTIKDESDHYADIKRKGSQGSITSKDTAHTSLGRSIRCGYTSYAARFLAEQAAGNGSGLLMLMDAPSTHSSNASSSKSGGLLQITNGASTMSIEEEKSKSTTSVKRGVYGGGVRYFEPDKSYYEEEEEASEEEEEEEDEERSDADDDCIEVEGSDMGSMFSEEEESCRPSNDGVESVASSTVNSEMSSIVRNSGGVYMADSKLGNRNTLNKKRAPTPFDKSPEMVPISDESESGSW